MCFCLVKLKTISTHGGSTVPFKNGMLNIFLSGGKKKSLTENHFTLVSQLAAVKVKQMHVDCNVLS